MITRVHSLPLLGAAVLVAVAVTPAGWSATLSPVGGSAVSGTARVEAAHAPDPAPDTSTVMKHHQSYTASASVNGADAGATLAWFIHTGGCDGPGTVLGEAAAYPAIKADAQGAGSATATVMATMEAGKQYSVAVHAGSGTGPVVSCGNLRPTELSGTN